MPNIGDLISLLSGQLSDLPGWQQAIYLTDPAAGADWQHRVPGEYWERVLAVTATLVTSATAGTRYPNYQVTDGQGNIMAEANLSGSLAPSVTSDQFLWLGCPTMSTNASGRSIGALPDLIVPSGWYVQSSSNLKSGDQYSGVRLIVQRFPTNRVRALVGG